MKNCRWERQLAPYYKLLSFSFIRQKPNSNIRNRHSKWFKDSKAKQTISTQWANRKTTASNSIIIRQMEQRAISKPVLMSIVILLVIIDDCNFSPVPMWFGNICCRFSIVIRIVASIWIIYFLEIGGEYCTSLILPRVISYWQHDTIFFFEVYFLLLWNYDKRMNFGPSVENHAQLRSNHTFQTQCVDCMATVITQYFTYYFKCALKIMRRFVAFFAK